MEAYDKKEKGFYFVEHYHGYASVTDIYKDDIKPDPTYEESANKVSPWCESTQMVFFTDGDDNWYLCNNNSTNVNTLLLQRIKDGDSKPYVGFYRVFADSFFESIPFFQGKVDGRVIHEFGKFFDYEGPYESLEDAISNAISNFNIKKSDMPFEHGSHYYWQLPHYEGQKDDEPLHEQIFCYVDENKNVKMCTS